MKEPHGEDESLEPHDTMSFPLPLKMTQPADFG